MDHEVAIQTHAVERYLLGEMPQEERDSFEAHYFSCSYCAEDIRAASNLVQDAAAVLKEGGFEREPPKRDWLSWLRPQVAVPTFAAVACAMVVMYQNAVTMPGLRAPQSMGAAVILDGATRSAMPTVHAGSPLRFQLAVEDAGGPRVAVEIADASGSVVRKGVVAAPAANQALDVFFPGKLDPGKYALVARQESGKELARSSFEVVQ